MATIKWGVIGLGLIAPSHLDCVNYCKNTELAAVCDKDEEWVKFAKEKYGAKKCYTDYHDLLADPEVDAISVCLPNYLHAQVTIDALNAGKHVLCEKPMAPTAAEGRLMKEAADRSGKRLMIVQNQRFFPVSQYMKKLYDEGKFGEVYHIRTGWRRPLGMMPSPEDKRPNGIITDRNWYNDKSLSGGVLRDLGVHMIDLAMYITGFPNMTDAIASAYRKFEPNVPDDIKSKYSYTSEDLVTALIKFDNGMSLDLEVSFGSAVDEEAVFTNIYGTKMGADRRGEDQLKLIDCSDGVSFKVIEPDYKSAVKRYGHCVQIFADALENDEEPPVRPEETIQVLEVLDKLYETAGFRK